MYYVTSIVNYEARNFICGNLIHWCTFAANPEADSVPRYNSQ